jgi:hypothetical protein
MGGSAAASYHHPASSHPGLAPFDQLISGGGVVGEGGWRPVKGACVAPPSSSNPDGTLLLYTDHPSYLVLMNTSDSHICKQPMPCVEIIFP